MTETLGSRIRLARKTAKLTQHDLGRSAGVSSQAVNKWEANKAKPTIDNLAEIARTTGRSAQWLIFGDLSGENVTGTLPTWLGGGRTVPIIGVKDAARRTTATSETTPLVVTHFPCSAKAFAIELTDDSNGPRYPKGCRWIVDHEAPQEPGKMVLAAYGSEPRPVLGELSKELSGQTTVVVVAPLDKRWQPARSDVEKLEIIAVMTEAILPGP